MNVGGSSEALDQQTDFVIERRVHWAAEGLDVAFGEPGAGGIEQRVGDGLVVEALEEAEKAATFVKVLIVVRD